MSASYLKEACVETLDQALRAEELGANRLELCSNLHLEGLTPGVELITNVIEAVHIPVHIMVRPRAGNFVYTQEELRQMEATIQFCKQVKAAGVVFGVLSKSSELDISTIEHLIQVSKPLKVVIHKAIDETRDVLEALKQLLKIQGLDSVLTSGGELNAHEGILTLRKMIAIAKDRLIIMPAGNITWYNIQALHEKIGARAYHGKRVVGEL